MASPVMPKGAALVRMLLHAHKKREDVDSIGDHMGEMLAIGQGGFIVLPPATAKSHTPCRQPMDVQTAESYPTNL